MTRIIRPHRRRTIRTTLVVVAFCAALILPATALSYHIWTYVGPSATIAWNNAYPSGTNNMQMNRVYRPTPKTFALWYNTSQGYQFEQDRFTNPFVHDNPGGYTNSNCADTDPYVFTGTSNVTCQYKTFH